jgi:[ribosomal protein S5]-alanine N-acetyltransferase
MNAHERAEVSPDWLSRADAAIGMCLFKGPPNADGIVEIAYGIDPEHQGRGYATEAAEALVTFAFSTAAVRAVRAHTFAEVGASSRVLTKCGFRPVGQVIDPEDGSVWRWEREKEC